ncbi:hypothetical protein [Dyadobacter fanqingshengii]|uniref:Uncharacterized protein n=1 Tax=Dyadobacter fanqingshengii TaxID=2906443 RepID=A0A9X1PHW3_9BACT|nr:hypothetical protein [Dyadobacter fanqingshengii]MCF0043632.1 hypothetical protein [Dyadobacter fanqingshengii]USJ34752.1 hypothetical protein NFI81_18815 [Dyadobacter fanqingshengii]
MNQTIQTILAILAALIPFIISALFNESILQGIAKLFSKIDLPRKTKLKGTWDVHFSINNNGQQVVFSEVVQIRESMGFVFGNNVPDLKNHPKLKAVQTKRPRRIKAIVIDNRYVTGTWYHPDGKTRYHGSFQLLLAVSGSEMAGIWTGYRESTNDIESGTWNWIRRS